MENEFGCARYLGRTAIVTGAAKGLGVVLAHRLAAEGATLVLADILSERLEWVAGRLQADTGKPVYYVAGDLTQRAIADRLVATALDNTGRLDTLVNNAAVLVRKRLVDFDDELLKFAVDTNVWPAIHCCRAAVPVMIEQQYGRIVNVGGEAWRTGAPYHAALAGVGKGSLVGLTATLAGELGANGITVNCVSPGFYEPEASEADELFPSRNNPDWTPPDVLAELQRLGKDRPCPIPRAGKAHEVAAAIAFFGAPESSYVTGQHLGASGGMAML